MCQISTLFATDIFQKVSNKNNLALVNLIEASEQRYSTSQQPQQQPSAMQHSVNFIHLNVTILYKIMKISSSTTDYIS